MLVVFGLGNPGTKYEGTRHNAGVETLLKMAAYYQVSLKRRCFSSFSSATIGDEVKLVFPLTYRNESGKVVPKTVNEGDEIKVGDKIGTLSGSHLHLGITKKAITSSVQSGYSDDGTWLDPIKIIQEGINN